MGVVLICGEVKFSKAKVNNFDGFSLGVNENVKWFNVPMHDPL